MVTVTSFSSFPFIYEPFCLAQCWASSIYSNALQGRLVRRISLPIYGTLDVHHFSREKWKLSSSSLGGLYQSSLRCMPPTQCICVGYLFYCNLHDGTLEFTNQNTCIQYSLSTKFIALDISRVWVGKLKFLMLCMVQAITSLCDCWIADRLTVTFHMHMCHLSVFNLHSCWGITHACNHNIIM